jgi:hypothetical protein
LTGNIPENRSSQKRPTGIIFQHFPIYIWQGIITYKKIKGIEKARKREEHTQEQHQKYNQ